MENNIRIVNAGKAGELKGAEGEILHPPSGWAFLPSGDAGITRKVTSKGAYWRVEVKKGRRIISLGIWAPASTIETARQDVLLVRQTEEYRKKQAYAAERRERKQVEYDGEFCQAVEKFLRFHDNFKTLGQKLAKTVTSHAIPVGSGTVARTQLIPIEERAALAVIAWMRHQTTAYDSLQIAWVKGERRAVRKMLAQHSVKILTNYREGRPVSENCPLQKALNK
ncbi:MAG: DUF2293 domain-containing protein [Prolixibacteraceae bacterium]